MSKYGVAAAVTTLLCLCLGAPAAPFVPGKSVTLPPEPGDLVQERITIRLPDKTPFPPGSQAERQYLQGYGEGFADAVRSHLFCRPRVGDRATEAWADGWKAGTRRGNAEKNSTVLGSPNG